MKTPIIKLALSILLIPYSLSLHAQDTAHFSALQFNKNMYNYLISVRTVPYFDSLMQVRHVSFQPIQLRDSSYILNANSLTDPNFIEIVDSIEKTTWVDSISVATIADSLQIRPTLLIH